MSKQSKMWLGIITFLPALLGLVFYLHYMYVSFMFFPDIDNMEADAANPFGMMRHMGELIFTREMQLVLFLSVAMYIGLLVYYIRHLNRLAIKEDIDKAVWLILFICTGHVSFIVYYFLKVVPDKTNEINDTL